MAKRYCKHGGEIGKNICPHCDNERQAKRQRAADRARFAEQLRRIKGEA